MPPPLNIMSNEILRQSNLLTDPNLLNSDSSVKIVLLHNGFLLAKNNFIIFLPTGFSPCY